MQINRLIWLAAMMAVALVNQTETHAAVTNIIRVTGPNTYAFSPTNIQIATGDSVRWTNVAAMATHDVTPGVKVGNTTNAPNPQWAPAALAVGGTFQVAFSNVGVYPYLCGRHVFGVPTAHPEQTGTVTVVQANLLPVVNLTSPTNLSTFTAPASLTLSATASDADGTVASVQFFSGTNQLGSVSAEPYELPVTLAAGWHQITARAIDTLGGSNTTEIVNVLVNSNRTVVVSGLTFSPSILTVTVGDTVTFNGLASFHTVTGNSAAEPFCGDVRQASCITTFNRVGSFAFHCIPHGTFGMTGLVQVVGPNLRPTGRITAPADGSVFAAPAIFNLSAEASDLYGAVKNVRFMRGAGSLGLVTNAPYTLTTTNATVGTFAYTVFITDDTDIRSTSAPVNITFVAPVDIQLLSPAASSNGFTFDYTANPGLTYIVEGAAAEGSPVPFVPISTNIANTNRVAFTDPSASNRANRAYRVLRQP